MNTRTLSMSMVDSALGNSEFLKAVPEFTALAKKRDTTKTTRKGCRSCSSRKEEHNVFRDFVNIALALSPEALARMKAHMDSDKLHIVRQNPITKAFETRIL